MPLPLGASVFAGQLGTLEPQREYDASISIIGVPGFGRGSSDDYITLSVLSFALPAEESEVQGLIVGNERRNFPGLTTYQPIPIVIRDMVDQDVAATLLRWRRAVYDPTRRGMSVAPSQRGHVDLRNLGGPQATPGEPQATGLPSVYKKFAIIRLYPPGSRRGERTFWVTGAWPSSISFGDTNQEGTGFNTVKMTLQYDSFVSGPYNITGI